jgi:glycosyltransferase involved in cell wall biosynthesis
MTNGASSGPALQLAVLPDFAEEQWPSMDLCAEMLLKHLGAAADQRLTAQQFRPRYRLLFTRAPVFGRTGTARNADRLLNRFRTYPRALRRAVHAFDYFHLCDQTYGHLLHALPPGRAGVFCHDLDAFRCLLEAQYEPRPRWFRAMMRRTLTGLQRAAVVFCPSNAVRARLESHGLIEPARIIVAPNGCADEFAPGAAVAPAGPPGAYLLHVGSCIARKRVDVLLETFAAVRAQWPGLRLLQIGGDWDEDQRRQIQRLGLVSAVEQRRGLSRAELALCYRGAALVLQPSSAEGFGLPVVEALACGAAVIASDLPTLREIGGPAAVYAPVGDVPAWTQAVLSALTDPARLPDRQVRLQWADRFSWAAQAKTIAGAYLRLAGGQAL